MVDPRAKGARGETQIRDSLRQLTKLKWERTPGSGALDAKHNLKGDLYVPNEKNLFAVECKNYTDNYLDSTLLTGKSPQLIEWWEQAVRQGKQTDKKPLLIFKFNRSKIFVAFEEIPSSDFRYIFLNILGYNLYISLLEDWITNENPRFIN